MERLGPNFSLSRMLVVDFMHEFELGVWRTLFIHLIRIRILHGAAPGGKLVTLLDERCDNRFHNLHNFLESQSIGFASCPKSAR